MPWGAAAALGAAYLGGEATKDAAGEYSASSRYAADLQQKRYEQSREDLEPWRASGKKALGSMDELMYGNPEEQMESLRSTPGYQFRLDEGLKALTRSSLAGSVSGNTFRGMQQYGQEFASKEFGRRFNRLSGMAQEGRGASQFTGQLGANAAARQGDYAMQGAEARAGAKIGRAKIYGNALGTLASVGKNVFGGLGQSAAPMGGNFYEGGRVAPGGSFAPSEMYSDPDGVYDTMGPDPMGAGMNSDQALDYGGNY